MGRTYSAPAARKAICLLELMATEDKPFSGEIKLITKNTTVKGIRKIAPTAINKKNVTVVRKSAKPLRNLYIFTLN